MLRHTRLGSVAEWSIAPVLKTGNGQPFVSSNLTASARPSIFTTLRRRFCFIHTIRHTNKSLLVFVHCCLLKPPSALARIVINRNNTPVPPLQFLTSHTPPYPQPLDRAVYLWRAYTLCFGHPIPAPSRMRAFSHDLPPCLILWVAHKVFAGERPPLAFKLPDPGGYINFRMIDSNVRKLFFSLESLMALTYNSTLIRRISKERWEHAQMVGESKSDLNKRSRWWLYGKCRAFKRACI